MTTKAANYGICGIVRCGSCPHHTSEICSGCMSANTAAREAGRSFCRIFNCVVERGFDSCLTCDEYPCETFISPGSKYVSNKDIEQVACDIDIYPATPSEVSQATITRLVRYLMVAEHALKGGTETITSQEFASFTGVKPELVRKDFTTFGHFGTRHVGYKLSSCIEGLRSMLQLNTIQNLVWVGMHQPYSPRRIIDYMGAFGLRVVAVMDPDPERTYNGGQNYHHALVFSYGTLKQIVRNLAVVGAVIACRDELVEPAVDHLFDLGVKSYLNLTSVPLKLPESSYVRNINLSKELMIFSYYLREG